MYPKKKMVPTTGIKFKGRLRTYRTIPSTLINHFPPMGLVMALPSLVIFPPLAA